MGIKSRLETESPQYARSVCRVCVILTQVDSEDAQFLAENFGKSADDKSRFSDAKIADILTDEGFPVGLQSVSRHRRRQCGAR